ncbi:MAG: transposase [bacterium]|nr:transposase [bacterium]
MGYRETGLGAYMHVCNRGVKKMPIYRNESDLYRLRSLLFYFNHDQPMPDHWTRDIEGNLDALEWPSSWQDRVPIVSVLAFTLMSNHLHLFLKEIAEGGIAKFMHRVSMAYSKFINRKYEESGSLFEGTYKSRIIHDEADFKNLAAYIMVKNPFELYRGGLIRACREFESAYTEALHNPFTSLRDYDDTKKISPILDRELLGELFSEQGSFKEFARECVLHRLDTLAEYDF